MHVTLCVAAAVRMVMVKNLVQTPLTPVTVTEFMHLAKGGALFTEVRRVKEGLSFLNAK